MGTCPPSGWNRPMRRLRTSARSSGASMVSSMPLTCTLRYQVVAGHARRGSTKCEGIVAIVSCAAREPALLPPRASMEARVTAQQDPMQGA